MLLLLSILVNCLVSVFQFFEVLGLPTAPKIPQHPALPGSGLEGQIYGKDLFCKGGGKRGVIAKVRLST